MPATRRRRAPLASDPLLSAVDFENHLRVHSATIAPADVTMLLSEAGALRHRLIGERAVHPQLAERAGTALALLADHSRGACPQIPYATVSLLATALYYYLAPMDVIPDFIPRAGTADDAVVLDIAWRLAAPGVRRYLDAREPHAAAPAARRKIAARPRTGRVPATRKRSRP